MFFKNDKEIYECIICGYKMLPPFPESCPKCHEGLPLNLISNSTYRPTYSQQNDVINQEFGNKTKGKKKTKKKLQKQKQEISTLSFLKSLKVKNNPDIVASSINEQDSKDFKFNEIQDMKVSNASIDEKLAKVKSKIQVTQVQIENEKIPLGSSDEYIKYIGLVTKNREEIFSLNTTFTYFLDLAVNLEYISTSILSGNLDRMYLNSSESNTEEICYFFTQDDIIFTLYGKIPEKKANWLMNQLIISTKDYIPNFSIGQLSKLDLYNIAQKYRKKILFLLETMIDLQDVFTPKQISSVEDYLRVDYMGLSYQSVGIISKLITDKLDIQDLPTMPEDGTMDFEDLNEIKEALITAKVEAIAANTYANTLMTPNWISVKLGFQKYRYILFLKLNSYYISILAQGNLEIRHDAYKQLIPLLEPITNQPFMGVLTDYIEAAPTIVEKIREWNQQN